MTRLFVFGLGYSALEIARRALALGWSVAGTVRDPAKLEDFKGSDMEVAHYGGGDLGEAVGDLLANTDHLLISIPPGEAGDPLVGEFARYMEAGGATPARITYLSSLSVYGDFGGAWIDETAPTRPRSQRGKQRLAAEAAWRAIGEKYPSPVDIVRLAGIYGPGRNSLLRLRAGSAKNISQTGQVFNRIHVADLATLAVARMQMGGEAGGIFNLCDAEPAPQGEVLSYAANLLGMAPPPAISMDEAGLSPLGRSFYEENKRVSNEKILKETGLALDFPTYREGLRALAADLISPAPRSSK